MLTLCVLSAADVGAVAAGASAAPASDGASGVAGWLAPHRKTQLRAAGGVRRDPR